jgi:PIN domain-containing protein
MPAGVPHPEALTGRTVSAFSLDTSVLEAAGFRFREGSLFTLASQLPPWVQLVMSAVVVEEMVAHHLGNVQRAVEQIQSGYDDIERYLGAGKGPEIPDELFSLRDRADERFQDDFSAYLARFNGCVLDLESDGLAARLSHFYFRQLPPFGNGRDKKKEFPDAMALLELEDYAARVGTQMVVVSRDEGWMQFAARSERLYCVASVNALAELFETTSVEARLVKQKIAGFAARSAVLRRQIANTLEMKIAAMQWTVPSIRQYGRLLTGSVEDVTVEDWRLLETDPRVWMAGPDRNHCVAVLVADVEVSIAAHIEIEKYEFGQDGPHDFVARVEQSVEVSVFLQVGGNLTGSEPENWQIDVDLADAHYVVDVSPFVRLLDPWRDAARGGFGSDDEDLPF